MELRKRMQYVTAKKSDFIMISKSGKAILVFNKNKKPVSYLNSNYNRYVLGSVGRTLE